MSLHFGTNIGQKKYFFKKKYNTFINYLYKNLMILIKYSLETFLLLLLLRIICELIYFYILSYPIVGQSIAGPNNF